MGRKGGNWKSTLGIMGRINGIRLDGISEMPIQRSTVR